MAQLGGQHTLVCMSRVRIPLCLLGLLAHSVQNGK